MDLNYTPEDVAFRKQVRAWMEANVPREKPRTLAARHGLAPQVLRRRVHRHAVAEGVRRGRGAAHGGGHRGGRDGAGGCARRWRRVSASGIVGPTIIVHGTDAQKQRYLKKILTAEEIWCQLYSEPNSGSDLASLRTRAEDRGDHYVVNGQKIWTSGGYMADWGLLLARTDPAVPKHKGITCFLIGMRQPGVDVRPLKQITGSSEFCEVFMTDARVEKSDLVGKLGEGWGIAQTTLGYERGGNSLARVTRYASQFAHLVEAARRLRRHGRPLIEDPVVRTEDRHASRPISRSSATPPFACSRCWSGASIPAPRRRVTKLSYSEFEKRFRTWRWRSSAPTGSSPTGVPPS